MMRSGCARTHMSSCFITAFSHRLAQIYKANTLRIRPTDPRHNIEYVHQQHAMNMFQEGMKLKHRLNS